jgi:DNA repair exonuclease SbcCD ATPase subunit
MAQVKGYREEGIRHKLELQKLRDQHKELLEKTKNEHKKQVETEKINHHYKLADLRTQNEQKVLDELERKDKVLSDLNQRVDKTRDITDKEVQNLKQIHLNRIEEREKDFEEKFRKRKTDNNRTLEDQHEHLDKNMRKMNTDYSDRERNQIIDHKYKLREMSRRNQQEFEKMSTDFRKIRDSRSVKFQKALIKQREEQVKQLEEEKQKHIEFMRIHQQRFQDEMSKLIQKQKQVKDTTQKDFENDYKRLLTEQRTLIDTLDQQTKELVTKGKMDLSKEKVLLNSQSQDKFYSMNKLFPKYRDLGDSYDVYISVPEHEKNSVNIMTKNRMVRISLDRRYDETLENGPVTNSSKKIETITTNFEVPDILDPLSKVRKTYKEGFLVFNIKKA